MSRENVEVIRSAFEEAPRRGVLGTAETYWHPNVEYVEDPRWPGASTLSGRDEVVGCFERYAEALGAMEDFTITVERVAEAGDRYVAFVRVRGLGTTSAAPHEHLWGYVVEIADRRVRYFQAYYEPGEALEAVGLRE